MPHYILECRKTIFAGFLILFHPTAPFKRENWEIIEEVIERIVKQEKLLIDKIEIHLNKILFIQRGNLPTFILEKSPEEVMIACIMDS